MVSAKVVVATQIGVPTDCGRLGYSSAFLVNEDSSAPVIEFAGAALVKTTALETAPSECVMGEANAECENRGNGCNDRRFLHTARALIATQAISSACSSPCAKSSTAANTRDMSPDASKFRLLISVSTR